MSSAPAAAAASSSGHAAVGLKRGAHDGDEERKESTPNKKARKQVECPICLEEFDLVASKLKLRVLPCSDTVCHKCLVRLIGMDRREVKCPRCQRIHSLRDPTGRLNSEQLALQFLTAQEYAQSLGRNRDLLHLVESAPPRCTDRRCTSDAAHMCMTCGLQCEDCHSASHPASSTHVRSSLADQRAAKQKELNAEAARLTAKSSEHVAAVDRVSKSLTETIANSKSRLAADLKRVGSFDHDIQELLRVVSRWKSENADRRTVATERHADLEEDGAEFKRQLEDRRVEANRLSRMPAETLVEMPESEVRAAFSMDEIDEIEESRQSLKESFRLAPRNEQHPATILMQQLNTPSLLPALTARLRSQLQKFLDATGKSLANTHLLYKASRDGWLPKDFHRCCIEKGPTLMLIKAAGTGYIFGAYTAVSWPKPNGNEVTVPDPSGASFLFSLINEYHRPFRLSLVDRSRAISLDERTGPCFGGDVDDDSGETVKFTNLVLMNDSRAADQEMGNLSNDHDETEAYQLDAWWPNQPPNGFKLVNSTLAGEQEFDAAEIEVYAL